MVRRLDSRGASEVIGFVLVFALVTTTVGAAYVWGTDGLQNARDFERTNNAQRAMEAFADNVDDLARRGAPSRATEIELADARIGAGDPVTVNVTASGPAGNYSTRDVRIAPIIYDAGGGERIRYVNGAVLRTGSGGATVVRDADLFGGDRPVVSLVQTYSRAAGVGGSASVLVRTEATRTEVVAMSGAYETVSVAMTTPYAAAWKRQFQRQGMECTATDGELVCEKGVEHLVLTLIRVAVTFES